MNTSTTNKPDDDENKPSSSKRKFTMRDALVYPHLKENPDDLRTFASTFLPIPGSPFFPLPPNADDAVTVSFVRQTVNVTNGSKIILDCQEGLLPLGAAKSVGSREVKCIIAEMFRSRFQMPTVMNLKQIMAFDWTCWGCKKRTVDPRTGMSCTAGRTILSASREILEKNVTTNYFICAGSLACDILARQAMTDFSGKDRLFYCNYCGKTEEKPHQYQHCPRCKVSMYCSKKCQEEDWKEHKKICKKMIVCAHCWKKEDDQQPLMKCGQCKSKSTMYCSKDCQTAHWKIHKKVCCKPRSKKKKDPSSK